MNICHARNCDCYDSSFASGEETNWDPNGRCSKCTHGVREHTDMQGVIGKVHLSGRNVARRVVCILCGSDVVNGGSFGATETRFIFRRHLAASHSDIPDVAHWTGITGGRAPFMAFITNNT